MSNSFVAKKSMTKRLLKHALFFVLMVIGLMILLKVGFSLMGTHAEQLQAMQQWRHSYAVLIIRFGVYTAIWFWWPAMMRKVKTDLTDAQIKTTRRPLIILFVVYELMIARDLTALLSSWSVG